jgi:hypothetical protein
MTFGTVQTRATQASTPVGERETGAPAPADRRAARAGRDGDTAKGAADSLAETAPARFDQRKGDDPAAPRPTRAVVQPTGVMAHAVGHAIRYLRRSTDALPPGAPLPSVDVVTPDLRQRILDADAVATAQTRFRQLRAWRGPVLAGMVIVLLLGVGWLVSGW